MFVYKTNNLCKNNILIKGPQVQPVRNGGAPMAAAQNQNSQQQQALNQLHHLQQQQQLVNEGILNNNQNIGGGLVQNSQKIAIRDNLHYAADSVSHAMTSLVRELNTGAL